MKRFVIGLLLIVLFGLLALPALAQGDGPAEPTAPPFGAPTPEEVVAGLLNAVLALFVAVPSSAFGVLVVSLVKRLPFTQGIAAPVINLVVGIVLTLVVWGAGALNLTTQLEKAVEIILTVAPILIGTGATSLMAAGTYNHLVKGKLPVVGYSRS